MAIRVVLQALTPVELAAGRYIAATLPAGIYLATRRLPRPRPRDLVRLAGVGVLFATGYAVLLNIGELSVPAAPASFIIHTASPPSGKSRCCRASRRLR